MTNQGSSMSSERLISVLERIAVALEAIAEQKIRDGERSDLQLGLRATINMGHTYPESRRIMQELKEMGSGHNEDTRG